MRFKGGAPLLVRGDFNVIVLVGEEDQIVAVVAAEENLLYGVLSGVKTND